jgi:radical SAM superfamily enzyme YgiQ (UPF0313 family)
MPIIEPVIRPPAEADSILIQATTGCSANGCDFCGAYTHKPFKMKPLDEILRDIQEAAIESPEARRVFLMDGDALVLSNTKLIPILEMIRHFFPRLTRIASYANGFNITTRSDEELGTLHQNQLRLIYMGLESGSDEILLMHHKRSTAAEMVAAVQRAKQAGIKSSVIVLLGLGGKDLSAIHIKETIKALNEMQPHYLSFLSLMVVPGTPLMDQVKSRQFRELNAIELLVEAHEIMKGLDLTRTLFRMNHASNFLPIEGTLPKDKNTMLAWLHQGITGEVSLKPEIFRGL